MDSPTQRNRSLPFQTVECIPLASTEQPNIPFAFTFNSNIAPRIETVTNRFHLPKHQFLASPINRRYKSVRTPSQQDERHIF